MQKTHFIEPLTEKPLLIDTLSKQIRHFAFLRFCLFGCKAMDASFLILNEIKAERKMTSFLFRCDPNSKMLFCVIDINAAEVTLYCTR